MRGKDFERIALALIERGFAPLPLMPGEKKPGMRDGGVWRLMYDWNDWNKVPANVYQAQAWSRMIGDDDAGIGVRCGRGLICIDIDIEEAVAPLLAILPPSPVQKKGKKGLSLFYRGDTEKIRSKNFRTPEKVGLVDLLAEGKQTVLPPSIHPDTGEPYYWWTDDTLLDLRLEDLPELDDDVADQIAVVLKQFGYDPEGDRVFEPHGAPVAFSGGSGAASLFREANDAALANLHAWVPKLGLPKGHWQGAKYRAVAPWRTSGSGRPMARRHPNLSFDHKGIQDFGTGEKFTPINVVMKAHDCTAGEALDWLAPLVGVRLHDPDNAALAERIIASALRKQAQ